VRQTVLREFWSTVWDVFIGIKRGTDANWLEAAN
jgi:hypothetical protein